MKDQTTCVHYFILPSPNGEECVGVCKHCGFTQLHKNFNKSYSWRKWEQPHKKDGVTSTQSK